MRRLAQAGKVAIGWSTAKIEAIARRPLQCYKCLEIGHVRRTCTAKEDRGHLCYRCGGTGHRAKGCTAANPKCPLCEAHGAPSAHRMGGPTCAPPRKERRKPAGEPGGEEEGSRKHASEEAGAEDAMEAMTLGD